MNRLIFATPSDPQVTIVIVTHGCRDVVAKALTMLLAQTVPLYELIVVDSLSPDDTGNWIEQNVLGARLIRSDVNIGYGAGSNLGAHEARAPLLLFLNPDVFVTRDWLQPLIKAMSLPGVGVAGPQLRYPNGMLQAAGSLVFRNAMTSRYGDGDPDPDSQVYQYPRMVDYVSGACLLIDRELFERLGGFDPIFGLGYFEDVDLCFKVAALDYRVLYVARSVVHHVRDASGGSRTLVDTVARNRPRARRCSAPETFARRCASCWWAQLFVAPLSFCNMIVGSLLRSPAATNVIFLNRSKSSRIIRTGANGFKHVEPIMTL